MRMKSLTKYLAALALLGAVTVHAQTAPATGSTPAAPAPAARPLTLAEMTERIGGFQEQIDDDAKHMRHLQEVARKQKDVIKLSCVNDKLVELKAQQNIFDLANQQFEAGKATSADAARPSYDELAATADAVKNLRGEADGCVGTPELYKQESDISVDHPEFADDPTTTDPFETELEPPAYASPFN